MFDHYKAIGIKAFTDGFSYDEYGYIYLVSILGPDSSVKGLSSAIGRRPNPVGRTPSIASLLSS